MRISQREPYVSLHPGMLGGDPSLSGYRMPVEQVAEMWAGGNWPVEEMHKDWPEITYDGVVICCWYMARYGSRKWKKAWRDWLYEHEYEMFKGERVPLPHQFLSDKLTPEQEAAKKAAEERAIIAKMREETAPFWEIDSIGERS